MDVLVNAPANATRNSLNISWTENADADFKEYRLYRANTSAVSSSSTLVAIIDDPQQTMFQDDDLESGTDYYYKMYVVTQTGLWSAGSNTVKGTTLLAVTPLPASPFLDDFEGSPDAWNLTGQWGQTPEDSFSGIQSFTDSPWGNYSNNANTWIRTSVDLQPLSLPVLRFRTRYNLQENKDFGYVEVSTDNGANWYKIYFATGIQEDWQQVKIDLSQWIAAKTLIRFRLSSDASVTFDGWYIDDVWIGESDVALGYPFFDSMDEAQTEGNWLASSWARVSPGYSGNYSFHDSPKGTLLYQGRTSLAMSGPVDLTDAQSPQLVFWHHYDLKYYDLARVQVHDGQEWQSHLGQYHNKTQAAWQKQQFDLSAYVGKQIRIRFYLFISNTDASARTGWFVDDVYVGEDHAFIPLIDWGILDRPTSITAMANEPTAEIFGQVFEPGITDHIGQGLGIIAQLGYGPDGSYPDEDWIWVDAAYAGDVGATDEYDEYAASLTVDTMGQYDYAYRFSSDGGFSWIYADTDGTDIGSIDGANGYSPSRAGSLIVTDQRLPDLIVESIVADPSTPAAGEDITVYVTVKNQGTADAGRFFTDFYKDLGLPPETGEAGNLYWSADYLTAGQSQTFSETISYAEEGEYDMYAQVDTDEQVNEFNEANNTMGPVDICVGGCLNDFNEDGYVDALDLAMISQNFGATDCHGDCPGDIGRDGVIDGSDLANFILDFGRRDIYPCP